jgi:hypothetical protein
LFLLLFSSFEEECEISLFGFFLKIIILIFDKYNKKIKIKTGFINMVMVEILFEFGIKRLVVLFFNLIIKL